MLGQVRRLTWEHQSSTPVGQSISQGASPQSLDCGAERLPAPVEAQLVRIAVRKREGSANHQLLRTPGHPAPDSRKAGNSPRCLPCLPPWPGHRIDAGRGERTCRPTAARSRRPANAGTVRARRSARPKRSGRTHNGFVFAAFCGEIGC